MNPGGDVSRPGCSPTSGPLGLRKPCDPVKKKGAACSLAAKMSVGSDRLRARGPLGSSDFLPQSRNTDLGIGRLVCGCEWLFVLH